MTTNLSIGKWTRANILGHNPRKPRQLTKIRLRNRWNVSHSLYKTIGRVLATSNCALCNGTVGWDMGQQDGFLSHVFELGQPDGSSPGLAAWHPFVWLNWMQGIKFHQPHVGILGFDSMMYKSHTTLQHALWATITTLSKRWPLCLKRLSRLM